VEKRFYKWINLTPILFPKKLIQKAARRTSCAPVNLPLINVYPRTWNCIFEKQPPANMDGKGKCLSNLFPCSLLSIQTPSADWQK